MRQSAPDLTLPRKRHPSDVIRILLGVITFGITAAMALGGHVSRTEEYLFRLIDSLPGFAYPVIYVIMQAGTYGFVWAAALLAAILKHFRLAIKIALSGTSAWLLVKLAKLLVRRDRPFYLFKGIINRAHATGILGFPSGHAAIAATLATVISPYVGKKWRRLMWTGAWVVAIARVYSGAHLPLDIFAGASLGWVIGSAFNLAFSTPQRPIPFQGIRQKLYAAGLEVSQFQLARVDARGSTPLFITTKDGQKFFGKLVSSENRDADVLYRLWRRLTRKENEGEALYASAIQIVEHEAYLCGLAASVGARVPVVRLATPVTNTIALLVSDRLQGETLNRYDNLESASLLADVWRQVRAIHSVGLAHRDLRAANVIVDNERRPWLIDFSFSELVSGQQPLALDRAEFLASLSLIADPAEVVKAAVQVLGKDTMGETVQYLQASSLGPITRGQIQKRKGLLKTLKQELQAQTDRTEKAKTSIYRLNRQTIPWILIGLLLVYALFTQLHHFESYLHTLTRIGLWWTAGAVVASVASYVASALAVVGSTGFPLKYRDVFALQLATSFINRFTPLNVGQVVLTQRFLENSGLKRADAVASTSLVYLAGIITHVFLLLLVVMLFVRYPIHFHHPSTWLLGVVAIIVIAAVVVTMTPKFRPLIRQYLNASLQSLRHSLTHPVKALQLYGGSTGISLLYAAVLYCSLRGFGANLAFDKVLLAYLAGSAIASAVPTPGGLGATELALVAALVTFGVASAPAVLGVLAFRLFTYLLPTLPGFFGFRYLQRAGLLSI